MSDTNVIQQIGSGKDGQISAAAYSIIGHREYQQDYAGLLVEPDQALAVVCDGMGGLNGGERASREAVAALLADYRNNPPGDHFSEFLCAEAAKMDALVHGLQDETGAPLKAGSTVVSVIVRDGMLYWMSVGDSRIYVLREDTMVPVTKDHNYRRELEEALARGDVSREQFEKESHTRKAEALTNYLGMGGLRRIEWNAQPFRLEDGDEILLCSDGLYKSLDVHQIKAMLLDNRASVRVAAKRLVRMALDQAVKSQDNTTVILMEYHNTQSEEDGDGTLLQLYEGISGRL